MLKKIKVFQKLLTQKHKLIEKEIELLKLQIQEIQIKSNNPLGG